MQVVVEGTTSESTTVDSGVPQGKVLGPLLYLCQINDLPEAVRSKVHLFTDEKITTDATVSSIHSQTSTATLFPPNYN